MQGVTNAAPPSGGLRIVASGETDSSNKNVQFPEPALFVVIVEEQEGGYHRTAVIPSDTTFWVTASEEPAAAYAMGNPSTLVISTEHSSTRQVNYYAYA